MGACSTAIGRGRCKGPAAVLDPYLDREDRLAIGTCGHPAGRGLRSDDEPASRPTADPGLPPTLAAVTRACHKATGPAAFPVLCPTRWPPHGGVGQPKLTTFARTADAYLLNTENGFRRRGAHVLHLLLGGQRRAFGPGPSRVDRALRLATRTVSIPMADGGSFVQERPARRIRRARVHGIPATVLKAPPYPQGGIHGGHVLVVWNEGGHGYLVSAHGTRMTQRALIEVTLAIARSTGPARGATG